MGKRIVVALGGNALQDKNSGNTANDQLNVVKNTCERIADLIEEGYDCLIVHGNGPQVGRMLIQQERAKNETPALPIDCCDAMSEGYIGYHIIQGLNESLNKRGINKKAVTLLTQVVVDSNDPGFKNPTKPIGPFLSKEEALKLPYPVIEDSGRGYRRVVASPNPIDIVELDAINELSKNYIVVSCGGGGIPVKKEDEKIIGVECVIDKDKAASLLADKLNCDILLILTDVEKAYINYKKENQTALSKVSTKEVEAYLKNKEFATGSMAPKVEACISFVKGKENRVSIITSLNSALDAINGKTGTMIID